ncbi:MAG: class I SAM-dependent methyltransferase [Candidatus Paceibacterota bacterium]
MKKSTSWGGVSKWYDELLKDNDSYQAKVILPNLTRILGDIKGKYVLDLACGQGFFSQAFKDLDAHVMGIDIAPELIERAREHVPSMQFHVAPAHVIPMVKSGTQDVVVITLALQNIKEYRETIAECARVLMPGGQLTIVLNHPMFRIPKKTHWEWDEEKKIQYRRVDSYMSESAHEIDMHPGEQKKKQVTVSFHRPLQVYVKALLKEGFLISGIEEWISHKKSEKGPRQKAEDVARKEIPLFMAISAKREG